jgi:CDGSH-type Zn-finger protein
MADKNPQMKIVVQEDGPYVVEGHIPLVRMEQVVSEYGEPLEWKRDETIETKDSYDLCRCGHSKEKPFCDSSHFDANFDGAETADTNTTAERQIVIPGGENIVVRKDVSLCMDSGFCANRFTRLEKMMADTDNPQVRAQVIAMIEHCPSGAFVYSLEEGGPDIEQVLPQEIAVVTEIIDAEPVTGPLWVMGNIPVERADGKLFEARNRVTLCSCGRSKIKPLCDGTHRKKEE